MSEALEIEESDFTAIDESSLRRVTEIFNQFIKTVKARLVYPSSSKLPQQFLEKLHAEFSSLLSEAGRLKFKIEADTVLYKDQVIYRAVTKTENFAHPFFRDGIIELEISDGLIYEELEKFVEIVSLVTRSAHIEDDLATLLWEVGFESITYKLMDDSLDFETFEYGTSSIKTAIEQPSSGFTEIFAKEDGLELTEEDFDLDSDKNRNVGRPPAYNNVPDNVADYINNITEYDESEKSAIAEIVKNDEGFNFKQYVIEILFEILGGENDTAGYNETLDLISKVRDDFIKSEDFHTAIAIFNLTRELEEAFRNLGDKKEQRIREFIKSFGASERIRILVDVLNNAKDIDYKNVTDYLKMLSWESIDPLVWALGELEQYAARRAVCQALEVIAEHNVEILGKGVENPRWYVVRNIVMVMGKIGSNRSYDFLRRTVSHSDIRVRKETVVAAARIGTEQSADILIAALSDDSESLQTLALRELVKRKFEKAFAYIEQMIEDKRFKSRSVDQIKELLEGYAKLGSLNAYDKLKKLATQKSLIPSEKAERIKYYSIMALGYVKSPQAKQILTKISKSRNKRMVDAARRSLNRRQKETEIV